MSDAPKQPLADAGSSQIPLGRVKRIVKTDPDVKHLANDAAFLIAKATVRPPALRCFSHFWQELFLEDFAKQSFEHCQRDERKVLHYKDLGSLSFVGLPRFLTPRSQSCSRSRRVRIPNGHYSRKQVERRLHTRDLFYTQLCASALRHLDCARQRSSQPPESP